MNINQINIRQLTTDDLDIWKDIRLKAVKEHPDAFGSSFEEEILYSDEQFKKGLLESDIFAASKKIS